MYKKLSGCNVFHLTWIISLHYLVKLAMFVAHVTYKWVARERNSGICKRRCTKYASMISTNWSSDWERSVTSWITSSLPQTFISSVVASASVRDASGRFQRSLSDFYRCTVSIFWLHVLTTNSCVLFVSLFLHSSFWLSDVIM